MLKFINLKLFKMRWKRKNSHNSTWPGKVFDIDKVFVGQYTYGEINVDTSDVEKELLRIGSFCSIASNVKFILSGEHNVDRLSTYPFKQKIIALGDIETITKGPIIIDDDVWIGEGVIVLSGVHVGRGAVIAAGSVVVSDIEPYAIVGGVPARMIRKRFDDKLIEKLMRVDYDRFSKTFIEGNIEKLYEKIDENYDFSYLPIK